MDKAQKKEEMQKKKQMERLIKIFPNRFSYDLFIMAISVLVGVLIGGRIWP